MSQSRGLLLISFNYEFTPTEHDLARFKAETKKDKRLECIHEEVDKDAFTPSETGIGYIHSNYTSLYHEKWIHLSKEYIEREKKIKKENGNKRGRKAKPKPEKDPKFKHFMSCITFGVVDDINPNRIIGVKMFRNGGGNIACLTYNDSDEFVVTILNKLFRYVESCKPGLVIRYVKHARELSNNSSIFPKLKDYSEKLLTADYTVPVNCVINLYKLDYILKQSKYREYYWSCSKMIVVIYDQTALIIKCREIISREPKKGKVKHMVYTCKVTPLGKVYVYGGNQSNITARYIGKLWELLEENANVLIGIGYPSKPKKD